MFDEISVYFTVEIFDASILNRIEKAKSKSQIDAENRLQLCKYQSWIMKFKKLILRSIAYGNKEKVEASS